MPSPWAFGKRVNLKKCGNKFMIRSTNMGHFWRIQKRRQIIAAKNIIKSPCRKIKEGRVSGWDWNTSYPTKILNFRVFLSPTINQRIWLNKMVKRFYFFFTMGNTPNIVQKITRISVKISSQNNIRVNWKRIQLNLKKLLYIPYRLEHRY